MFNHWIFEDVISWTKVCRSDSGSPAIHSEWLPDCARRHQIILHWRWPLLKEEIGIRCCYISQLFFATETQCKINSLIFRQQRSIERIKNENEIQPFSEFCMNRRKFSMMYSKYATFSFEIFLSCPVHTSVPEGKSEQCEEFEIVWFHSMEELAVHSTSTFHARFEGSART